MRGPSWWIRRCPAIDLRVSRHRLRFEPGILEDLPAARRPDRRSRALFTPSLRLYFEQRAPVTVEALGHELLVYRSSHRVKPEDVRGFVDDALAIARQLER